MARYLPNWDSLNNHKVPAWYDSSKLGIFIHWGIYSVPAYAPLTGELGSVSDKDWFLANPYAEWYYNSINVKCGPTYEHHLKNYGADFKYEKFADMWKAENWDPDKWVDLFEAAGAKYIVVVSKHHDGFCLYPSQYTEYNSLNYGPKRNILGELASTVRNRGMRFGIYYSGMIDWTFMDEPIFSDNDVHHSNCPTFEYADYVFKQLMELIDSYHPDVLWNDIGWPYAGEHMLPHLLAHYYNTCPDGVANDRFNGLWHDYRCKEYQQGSVTRDEKWEMTRGLGLSFGYNSEEKPEHILSAQSLTGLLASTVANNGNLLINVGPMADGTIPEAQEKSLRGMGDWLKVNGEAIYSTQPDVRESIVGNDINIHFTKKDYRHYVIIDGMKSAEFFVPEIQSDYVPLDAEAGVNVRKKKGGLYVSAENADGFPIVLASRY